MPKRKDDYPDLPGISRSEALRRLRKAGIKFRTLDRPTYVTAPSSSSSHRYDLSLGYRTVGPESASDLPISDAERFGPIAKNKREAAKFSLQHEVQNPAELGTRLLERYPKAAARRAVGPGPLTTRVARGASLLLKKMKKRGGTLGLGLTAASIGSSIKEARKK